MQMELNERQHEKAELQIRVSFEPDSNVIDAREEQFEKQPLSRSSTVDGIQIDFNVTQSQNTRLQIQHSFESHSNTNDDREERLELSFRAESREMHLMERGRIKMSTRLE
jgi:hypothetical protein